MSEIICQHVTASAAHPPRLHSPHICRPISYLRRPSHAHCGRVTCCILGETALCLARLGHYCRLTRGRAGDVCPRWDITAFIACFANFKLQLIIWHDHYVTIAPTASGNSIGLHHQCYSPMK